MDRPIGGGDTLLNRSFSHISDLRDLDLGMYPVIRHTVVSLTSTYIPYFVQTEKKLLWTNVGTVIDAGFIRSTFVRVVRPNDVLHVVFLKL